MAGGVATRIWGPSQQPVRLPGFLHGQVHALGVDLGAYRLFLVALVAVLVGGLGLLVSRTRYGAQLRAAVDNHQAAVGVGINVGLLFNLTFALGSGLAGLGGALAIDVLGLDPTFALKYLVYFLIVVVVGGAGSLKGSLIAALLLGVLDVTGKYYVPRIGSFTIYAAMVLLLILFPSGLHGRRV
jgi:branched-chain amino acid transport system permease protein